MAVTSSAAIAALQLRIEITSQAGPLLSAVVLVGRIWATGCRMLGTSVNEGSQPVRRLFVRLSSEDGQDIAEYAVMVAVILLIVVGTLRLIGSNANTVFS
jgi:Flp pilus assembly pilin Flp